jgi:two-component system LytT family response regulator
VITALVVDDEPMAIERLTRLLEAHDDVDVIGSARSVDDAERFLARRRPDIVFLDVHMPGRLGVDLVSRVPERTKVVLVTADDGYALEAFRGGAIDYLLKPVSADRLAIALDRLPQRCGESAVADSADGTAEVPSEACTPTLDSDDAVTISMHRGTMNKRVAFAEIAWIEAVQNYTRVQIGGDEPMLVRRTMAEWEAHLPADRFHRISRSLIVQLPAITTTRWQSRDQTLVLFAGVREPLPLGRTASARLKSLLQAE